MISSAVLQIIAMVCMLLDHIGFFLLNDFLPFRIIGRIAMPLFVFGLAEGFIHTSSKTKYFIRLLIFAIISEVPLFLLNYILGHIDNYPHTIILNFLLGFIALLCITRNKYLIVFVPILAGLGSFLNLEYGWLIVPLLLLFYAVLKNRKQLGMAYYLCLLAALVLVNGLLLIQENWMPQLFGILAFIPIALYGGAKGKRLPKYLNYAFYPCHLMAIYIIKVIFSLI